MGCPRRQHARHIRTFTRSFTFICPFISSYHLSFIFTPHHSVAFKHAMAHLYPLRFVHIRQPCIPVRMPSQPYAFAGASVRTQTLFTQKNPRCSYALPRGLHTAERTLKVRLQPCGPSPCHNAYQSNSHGRECPYWCGGDGRGGQ